MSTTLERLQYGFDRDSRRTWRRRVVTTGEDNAYGYDGLSQVTQAALGSLNLTGSAISGVPAEAEAWDYDPTGNWRGNTVEDDGSVTLDQSRVHDKGNRLTQIVDDPYAVLLDRAGRMTQVSPDASGDWDEFQEIKWDAWGRITQVKRASDGAVLGSYGYDGLTRRTTRTVDDTTTHSYYSDQWRPLEEREDDETTASLQYYWGARHRDDLVRRDRATTDGGDLDETRYVLMDYYSPAAITDETGTVTERYAFTAFGVRSILAPDFSPRTTSECAFEFAFQGQFLDTESGFLNYGHRYLSPYIGRWLSKDPIAELGGLNLCAYVRNNAINAVDPTGLWSQTGFATCFNDQRLFCNHNPDNANCPRWTHQVTGAWPNVSVNYNNPGCKCHDTRTYQAGLPSVDCGDQVTVTKGACSVTIVIIDAGPANAADGIVDLSPDAAQRLFNCLFPGGRDTGGNAYSCGNFKIADVTVTG